MNSESKYEEVLFGKNSKGDEQSPSVLADTVHTIREKGRENAASSASEVTFQDPSDF